MAARMITSNYDFINTRGEDLMKQLHLQPFEERLKYNLAVLMYKSYIGKAPFYIQNKITLAKEINAYNLRSSDDLKMIKPLAKCQRFKTSFAFMGPTIWNELPFPLRTSKTVHSFKCLYKKTFF